MAREYAKLLKRIWADGDFKRPPQKYATFSKQTGIELDAGIGIDSTVYPSFHGVPVKTEVCVTDFSGVERGLFE